MTTTRFRRPRIRTMVCAVALALTAASCSIIGGGGDTYEVIAYFPRAVSLYEEGSVQVLGLPAGTISGVEVEGDQVKVTMEIDSDIPIPEGVMAAIAPQSLIGERRVQLSPPYREGDPVIEDGYVIQQEDTVIPVEPDEAFQALKDFLDTLDANGIGRLIENGAETLDGQGQDLGNALDELTTLVSNVEAHDDDIISIAERFDDFTSTLLTREAQLGNAIEDFASVANILAEERSNIENLVNALTNLSGSGLDLVSEHALRLRTDVDIVTRLAASIKANLSGVEDVLEGGLALSEGLANSYNPELHAINLRTNLDGVVAGVLNPLLQTLGLAPLCLDLIGSNCPPGTTLLDSLGLGGVLPSQATGTDPGAADDVGATEAELVAPTTPIDSIITAFGTPGEPTETGPVDTETSEPSTIDRLLSTLVGIGS